MRERNAFRLAGRPARVHQDRGVPGCDFQAFATQSFQGTELTTTQKTSPLTLPVFYYIVKPQIQIVCSPVESVKTVANPPTIIYRTPFSFKILQNLINSSSKISINTLFMGNNRFFVQSVSPNHFCKKCKFFLIRTVNIFPEAVRACPHL